MFLQILESMVSYTVSRCGSFSFLKYSRLTSKFNAEINIKNAQKFQRCFCGDWGRLRLACFATTATCRSFEDLSGQENEGYPKGIDFLNFMEERGIRGNYQTFLLLLEGCSLEDGNRLHGKILKLGFDREYSLCDKLIDFYLALGDLDGALKVFDDMPTRNVFSWNKMIAAFLAKKLTGKVLDLFSRMVVENNVNPNESTFAAVLRSLVAFDFVEQIHGRIIRHGFGASTLICNPLIDLYSKNGYIISARKVFDKLYLKDKVSWVAMISGLSQNGFEEDAIRLFCDMHASGILPTPYTFSSVLSACTKIESFDVGDQIHGLVFKFGFSSETYVCNALVTFYSRLGNLISAEQIFCNMWEKDSVTYNSLISGLAQHGYGNRAMKLFEEMQLDSLKPDCITVACLLSACASIGALIKGQQLHSFVIKLGMSSDIIIEGSLLDLYVKCFEIETAHEFFLTTETGNVVLWNVMLVAYGQLENLDKSFRIFRQMLVEGVIPNQFTYPSILRTCTSLGALELGKQIHSQAIKTGFQFNVYVCSVLIGMYAKLGQLDTAYGILRRLGEEDIVSWTAMIAGYTQHDLFAEALKLFGEMLSRGIQCDNIGFSSAISACAGLQAFNQGQQLHAQSCVAGYSNDPSIGNSLVSLYSRCGKKHEAYLAFEKIEAKDNISWNSLISGLAQGGYCEEALQTFAKMNKAGIEANLFTFCSTISAAANIADIKQGKQIHAMVIKRGCDLEIEASNALITLYSKCGGIADAKRQFFEMPGKNQVSWNAMITGYSQHGFGVEALDLFEKMKQLDVTPNHVTFVGVLSACSHAGFVNKGLSYFASMTKEHGLVPEPNHYVCVVDLLGRAGLLTRAKKFIEEMPVEPDANVWRTLLSACIINKNMKIGEYAASHLLGLEPEDSATYVLLSNIYAVTGNWDARNRTRQMMKERGVKKEAGRSWIEVKNSVHAFFVGDQLHPLADKIYEYIGDLNKRAAEIGYVQDYSSLSNEVEQGQKDPIISTHSEKLAIAFGLLSLSRGMPIRVIKNLRVCNDCHNWIKFVSKISNRAIVVRDTYRFHHFEGGICSCRDYW
ncbi:pentatricopeptide repeat-containing protein At4g13650 isoform X1 [Carica papaya]|uniref:pentatricopeptide repeat-containing protein At4g13650 isoform X1 n=1 Tax=Carica papaya TaxID=3649 RepID=UPI000B8C890A|nr:pentatricopeptide repeat-containing protein At4g13650 isoform X1 [Carica papaya]